MRASVLGLLALGLAAAGCMPKMTIEELKAMRPQRPVELERLNIFAGRWEIEGTTKISGLDRTLTVRGTSEGQWEGDNWYLVTNNLVHMEELGEMTGQEVWTYDAKAGVYRYFWVDSMGMSSMGTARYDAGTDTWKLEAKNHGPDGTTSLKGTCTIIDDNTTQWHMEERTGLTTLMEMDGTCRRIR
jgi:hypothetical protein